MSAATGAPKSVLGDRTGATGGNLCDGGHEDFCKRFLEDEVVGEGEFGQVRMVYDVRYGVRTIRTAIARHGSSCSCC